MTKATTVQPSPKLLQYSTAIAKCSVQATLYAKCVVEKSETIKKDACLKEFNDFKACFKNAIKK